MADKTRLTVNGVEIEIEGHAEVKVEDGKVKIVVGEQKVVERHYHHHQTIQQIQPRPPWEPQITWCIGSGQQHPDFNPGFPTIASLGGVVNG